MTTPKRNEAVAPNVRRFDVMQAGERGMVCSQFGEYVLSADFDSVVAALQAEVQSERQLRLRAEGLCSAWIDRHDFALESLNESSAAKSALQGEVSRLRGLLDAVEVQAEENFKKWERAETKLSAHREAETLCCKAFDALFEHSLSNGTYNYWGEALDCTPLNDARRALTNLEPS